MRYTKLFGKTTKTVPGDIEAVSHKLLHQGGFIRQISAGRYAFLPLGQRVWQKISDVIKKEMDEEIGAQQIVTPTLHPIDFWRKTNRDEAFGEEMMIVEDSRGAQFAIGGTAEGMMVETIRQFQLSYKDLPFTIYQFSNKFRDEKRPRGGLLRVREFMMKDAYSFAASEEQSLEIYDRFYKSYKCIARKFDLRATPVLSVSGAIGGDYNHEFMVDSSAGEGTYFVCKACQEAFTDEYMEVKQARDLTVCPECGGEMEKREAIEWGHVFKFDHFYTDPHEGYFIDKNGRQQPLWMGSYGIGVGRTMATIVETHHDEEGIIWPETVAPYQIYFINLGKRETGNEKRGEEVYKRLQEGSLEVLYDDRKDVSAGEKFADADLLGIPQRVVLSEKTLQEGQAEVKNRATGEITILPLSGLLEFFPKKE